MGAVPGFISIMHTWGSDLSFHPHIHVLCMGGGLDDERNWHEKKGGFFLPAKAASKLFRGKFMAGFQQLRDDGQMCYEGARQNTGIVMNSRSLSIPVMGKIG